MGWLSGAVGWTEREFHAIAAEAGHAIGAIKQDLSGSLGHPAVAPSSTLIPHASARAKAVHKAKHRLFSSTRARSALMSCPLASSQTPADNSVRSIGHEVEKPVPEAQVASAGEVGVQILAGIESGIENALQAIADFLDNSMEGNPNTLDYKSSIDKSKPTHESLQNVIDQNGLLGQQLYDRAGSEDDPTVGCAASVSYVLSQAGYSLPEGGINNVSHLVTWMDRNNFSEIDPDNPPYPGWTPPDGSVVVAIGEHVGILMQNGWVASNNSFDNVYGKEGEFTENYRSIKSWEKSFPTTKTYIFVPPSSSVSN